MKYLTKFVKHMRLFQMRIKKNYMMHVEDKKKNKLINRLLEGNKLNKQNKRNSLDRGIRMKFFKTSICFLIQN